MRFTLLPYLKNALVAGSFILAAGCGDEAPPAADTDAADINDTRDDADETGPNPDTGPSEDAEIAEDIPSLPPPPPLREPGQRAPLTSRCDPIEPQSCLLPWPSNRFLAADTDTETGLRLALEPGVLGDEEPIDAIAQADGFSRVSPIVLPVPRDATAETVAGALRVFVAEPGEDFGRELLMRNVLVEPRRRSTTAAVVGYTRYPMAARAEHLAVALTIPSEGHPPLESNRPTRVALGLEEPETEDEQALFAYHAPARALLAETDIALTDIARLWDFTTRSQTDALGPLVELAEAARQAVDAHVATVRLDRFEVHAEGPVAGVLNGHIIDLPQGDDTYEAPFRIALPRGEGDYRVILFGHGAGGNVDDRSFDVLMTESGHAKVGIEVEGWTGDDLPRSVNDLVQPIAGAGVVAARMTRAQARIAAIHRALEGPLADLLMAETILEQPNPFAGRTPDMSIPIWAGGSLGGVTGMVYSFLEPKIAGGVLNVPGAGFTHWLGGSVIAELLSLILEDRYDEVADIQLITAMSQGAWDVVDGAVWSDMREDPPIFAVQISIGDPVMPNIGSEMVATALNAVHLGVPISTIGALEVANEAIGRSGVTQFIAPGTSANAVHGFTMRNTEAARAAQQQFIDVIESIWAGAPVIRVPELCLELETPGRCDFSDFPE